MSCVMCHVSCVMCQLSAVTKYLSLALPTFLAMLVNCMTMARTHPHNHGHRDLETESAWGLFLVIQLSLNFWLKKNLRWIKMSTNMYIHRNILRTLKKSSFHIFLAIVHWNLCLDPLVQLPSVHFRWSFAVLSDVALLKLCIALNSNLLHCWSQVLM